MEFFREEENSTEGYAPKFIIAPYFRLKTEYSDSEAKSWLNLNNQALNVCRENCKSLGIVDVEYSNASNAPKTTSLVNNASI